MVVETLKVFETWTVGSDSVVCPHCQRGSIGAEPHFRYRQVIEGEGEMWVHQVTQARPSFHYF